MENDSTRTLNNVVQIDEQELQSHLNQVVLTTVEETVGPQMISRFNLFRSSTVTGGPNAGFSDGQATDEIERITKQVLPAQMDTEWSGMTYQQKAAGNLAPLIFGLAIVFAWTLVAGPTESATSRMPSPKP